MSALLHGPSVKGLISEIYTARRNRAEHPEGKFDSGRRWYPSSREDAGGSGSSTRAPSRAWPYSYMLRCRTRQHVTVLAAAWLAGQDVPEDVIAAVTRLFSGRTAGEARGLIRLESLGVRAADLPAEWLASVGADVSDDAPVLVLCDWLEEHGRGREAVKARARLVAERPAEAVVA